MRLARGDRERGAAVVEFALVIPAFMMIVVGMISSGMLYNQQMQLTHAAREGARHGATVASTQTFSDPAATWATEMRNVVLERAAGELTASQICVALVDDPADGQPLQAISDDHSTAPGSDPCFDDTSGGKTGMRVQVKVDKPSELDAVFFKMDVNLGAKASAKHES